MARISKPSAASATGSPSDLFRRARLKLTGLYVLVMLVVTLLFSVSLYANLRTDLHESIRGSLRADVDQKLFFQERDSGILEDLLLADAVVLAISAAAGYAFAGYALRPIRTVLANQEQFAADAAHELRTPLAVMRTQVEVQLRDKEPLPAKARATLQSVLDEVNGLARMTDHLLILAREHRTALPPERLEPVDVAAIAAQTAARLRPAADAKRIALEILPSPPLRVRAEEAGFTRILGNLMGNAVKFAGAGGRVSVSWSAEPGGEARVVVRDDGPGIAEKDLPHVFERFYKADRAHGGGGSGLGLAIVKRFAEQYGGSVGIKSAPGKGTDVTVRLKAA